MIDRFLILQEVQNFKEMLKLLQERLDQEVGKRMKESDEFYETPLDPGVDDDYVDSIIGSHTDSVLLAGKGFPFWSYGGFIVTVLSWLGDRMHYHIEIKTHPGYYVFMNIHSKHEYECPKEPFLGNLIRRHIPKQHPLYSRMLQWNELRNRFVHSYGIVVDKDSREKMTEVLSVSFDDHDWRMMLSAETCSLLLEDCHECLKIVLKDKTGNRSEP